MNAYEYACKIDNALHDALNVVAHGSYAGTKLLEAHADIHELSVLVSPDNNKINIQTIIKPTVDIQKACVILGFPDAGGEQRDRVRQLLETLSC